MRNRQNTFRFLLAVSILSQTLSAQVPTIDSVSSSSANGIYAPWNKLNQEFVTGTVDSVINITIYFSEAVYLSDGILKIWLNVGPTSRNVDIDVLSGLDSALTSYTVQNDDFASDLSVSSVSLVGDGATLKDSDGNMIASYSIPAGGNLSDLKDIILDGKPPSAPTGVTASPGDQTVLVSWDKSSETDIGTARLDPRKPAYYVYGRVIDEEATALAKTILSANVTSTLEDPISGLNNDLEYCYKVTAIDTLGNEGEYSDEICVTPFHPPEAGTILEGLSLSDSIDHRWTNSPTTLFATWEKFEDDIYANAANYPTYEYCVGLNAMNDIRDWTYIGLDTTVMVTGLDLIEGYTYKISARGTDVTLKSDTTTTDGITIDLTPPEIGSVTDGLTADLIFTNETDSLTVYWSDFVDSLSGTEYYRYTVSDTAGLAEEAKWDTTSNTSVTHDSTYHHGNSYFFSVTAIDSSGNISEISTSNGVTIDTIPPLPGIVQDGLTEELNWTTDSTYLASIWMGFSDDLSGLDTFQYAIGTAAGDSNFVTWTGTETDTSFTRSNLSLLDAITYYVSVRAFDIAGNRSNTASSSGVTVDLTPPSILDISPDSTTFIKLMDTTKLQIAFSEEIAALNTEIVSQFGDSVNFFISDSGDTAILHLLPPLISLDTLKIQLKNITDLRGLVRDSLTYEYYTGLLADFNDDLEVDVSDMTSFISQWPGIDIGPVSGTIPHFKPEMDGTTDLRDGMAFARMWRWSQEKSDSLFRFYLPLGDELSVEHDDRTLILPLPEGTLSGRIALRTAGVKDHIRHLEQDGVTADGIILTHSSTEDNILLLTVGYILERQNRKLSFAMPQTYSSTPIELSYIFYSKGGDIISMGTRDVSAPLIPATFALHQNYPNPFNPLTTIRYDLPHDSHVEIIIYDVLGRQVRTLVNKQVSAGYHSVVWGGKSDFGIPLGSGLYLYRIQTEQFGQVRKMFLLK